MSFAQRFVSVIREKNGIVCHENVDALMEVICAIFTTDMTQESALGLFQSLWQDYPVLSKQLPLLLTLILDRKWIPACGFNDKNAKLFEDHSLYIEKCTDVSGLDAFKFNDTDTTKRLWSLSLHAHAHAALTDTGAPCWQKAMEETGTLDRGTMFRMLHAFICHTRYSWVAIYLVLRCAKFMKRKDVDEFDQTVNIGVGINQAGLGLMDCLTTVLFNYVSKELYNNDKAWGLQDSLYTTTAVATIEKIKTLNIENDSLQSFIVFASSGQAVSEMTQEFGELEKAKEVLKAFADHVGGMMVSACLCLSTPTMYRAFCCTVAT
jgi:hypothetical protein